MQPKENIIFIKQSDSFLQQNYLMISKNWKLFMNTLLRGKKKKKKQIDKMNNKHEQEQTSMNMNKHE